MYYLRGDFVYYSSKEGPMGNKSKTILKERLEKSWAQKQKKREAKREHRTKFFRKRVTGQKRVRKSDGKI